MVISACVRRWESEHNQRAWLAWHIAALQRVKKLPKLDKFMVRKKKERQTPKQMKQIIEMYHAIHRGVDKRGKK